MLVTVRSTHRGSEMRKKKIRLGTVKVFVQGTFDGDSCRKLLGIRAYQWAHRVQASCDNRKPLALSSLPEGYYACGNPVIDLMHLLEGGCANFVIIEIPQAYRKTVMVSNGHMMSMQRAMLEIQHYLSTRRLEGLPEPVESAA